MYVSHTIAYHLHNINTAIHDAILDINTAIHDAIFDINTAIHNAIFNIQHRTKCVAGLFTAAGKKLHLT